MCVCVLESKELLNNIKKQISKVKDEIPLSYLADVSASLDQVQIEIDKYTPDLKSIASMR